MLCVCVCVFFFVVVCVLYVYVFVCNCIRVVDLLQMLMTNHSLQVLNLKGCHFSERYTHSHLQ